MKLQQLLRGFATTLPRETPSNSNVAPALWDGKYFYPQSDASFKLEPTRVGGISSLGHWLASPLAASAFRRVMKSM